MLVDGFEPYLTGIRELGRPHRMLDGPAHPPSALALVYSRIGAGGEVQVRRRASPAGRTAAFP